jgi:hypothetical protein
MESKRSSLIQRSAPFIPLVVLIWFSVVTLISILRSKAETGGTAGYVITQELYTGLGMLLLCLLSLLIYRPAYKYLLAATLLLGLCNIANFTLSLHTWSLGLNSLKFSFQPLSFFVIILTLVINLKRIVNMFPGDRVQNNEQTASRTTNNYFDRVEKFKENFNGKSDEALNTIIADQRSTPAAVDAAREIIQKRNEQLSETQNRSEKL